MTMGTKTPMGAFTGAAPVVIATTGKMCSASVRQLSNHDDADARYIIRWPKVSPRDKSGFSTASDCIAPAPQRQRWVWNSA